MSTPVPPWQAATTGSAPLARHINQFLGAHQVQVLYQATQTAAVVTNGAAHSNSNSLYMAQSFTTAVGQTKIGYVSTPLGSYVSNEALLGPFTLSLYANSAGAPSGPAIVTTQIATQYPQSITLGVDTVYVNYPLPATVTASTQ